MTSLRHLKSAFRGYCACYVISPDEPMADVPGFLALAKRKIQKLLEYQLDYSPQMKCWIFLSVYYSDVTKDEPIASDPNSIAYFPANLATCLGPNDIEPLIDNAIMQIFNQSENFEQSGSSNVIDCIRQLDIHVTKYEPVSGSTFVPLPDSLRLKRALINPQNTEDNQCFKWCILAALHPPRSHPERVAHYKQYEHELSFDGIDFPVCLDDVVRFEALNQISVNVYGHQDEKLVPLFLSRLDLGLAKVNLLLYSGHYCLIKSMDRLLGGRHGTQHRNFYCPKCLQPQRDTISLDEHMPRCKVDLLSKIVMPDEPVLKFSNHHRRLSAPLVVYSDFECFTTKIATCAPNPNASFSQRYQHHVPYSFGIVAANTCCNECVFDQPVVYRGPNCVQHFLEQMISLTAAHHARMNVQLAMTAADQAAFSTCLDCFLCNKPLGTDRVRDHCHICGKYRGALHQSCNLSYRLRKDVTCVFHNLRRYDGHLIMNEIGQICEQYGFKLGCIAKGVEDYVSFSLSKLGQGWKIRFIDSCQFLYSSLDNLVSSLPAHKLKAMQKFTNPAHLTLLSRKGVFPYDYVDSWAKLAETRLPPIEDFYSKLNDEAISDEDYSRACDVMKLVNNLGEYSDLYLKCDVLLLADVFENFRAFGKNVYDLDPAHYCTIPSFAFDACLKYTGVELQLFDNQEMYEFIESGIRGGISTIPHRKASANNPIAGFVNPEDPFSSIVYWDGNLYFVFF